MPSLPAADLRPGALIALEIGLNEVREVAPHDDQCVVTTWEGKVVRYGSTELVVVVRP